MRRLFQKRWVWFVLGMATLPTLYYVADLFLWSPNPKAEMPFTAIYEESRTETFLPPDYSYSLRSKGSMDEFRQFARKMRMEPFRVSDTRYERKERQHVTVISYEDGWITYHEDQT
jgi:hypothetical protein